MLYVIFFLILLVIFCFSYLINQWVSRFYPKNSYNTLFKVLSFLVIAVVLGIATLVIIAYNLPMQR